MATTNMLLDLPVVGGTVGPDWATKLNAALTLVDQHDHTTNKGVKVPSAGLNINAAVDWADNAITSLGYAELTRQGVAFSGAGQEERLHNVAGDLFWTNEAGGAVQITNGASLNAGAIGGIGGDYGVGGSVVTYSDATKTYIATQNGTGSGNLDVGNVVIHEPGAAATNGITLKSPTSLASAYSMIFPAALPSKLRGLSLNNAGQIAANAAALPWVTIGDGTNSNGQFEGTNQTPFTDAITALPNGGVIFVGRGTYTWTAQVEITQDDIWIIGEGADIVNITASIVGDSVLNINADNCRMEGVSVVNTASSASLVVALEFGPNSLDCLVQNCEFDLTGANTSHVVWMRGTSCTLALCRLSSTGGVENGILVGSLPGTGDSSNTNYYYNKIIGNIIDGATDCVRFQAEGDGSGSTIETGYNTLIGNVLNSGFNAAVAGYAVSGAGDTCRVHYNVASGNTGQGSFYGFDLHQSGAGAEVVISNAFFGNTFDLTDNMFNYAGVGNVDNSCSLAGTFVAATSGGLVTREVTDSDFSRN